MSKGNCIYKVCVYVGGFSSQEVKVVYTTSKMANAERYLANYARNHAEVCKAYIERSYGRDSRRSAKHMREDED